MDNHRFASQHKARRRHFCLTLLPPDYTARVLLISRDLQPGTEAVNYVEMINFYDKPPRYKSREPLAHLRYYCYAVLLPDQQVLVLGGKKGTKSHHAPHNMKSNNIKAKDIRRHGDHDHCDEVHHDSLPVMESELYT